MNSEELAIISLPKMQKLFREKMGKWQVRDFCYHYELGMGIYVKQEFGSYFSFHIIKVNPESVLGGEVIRIPQTIDQDYPERGLWGMVDWDRFHQEQYGSDGEIAVWTVPFISFDEEMGIPVKDYPFIIAQPTLAILKALVEQIGGKI